MFSNSPSASPVTRRRLTSAPAASSWPTQYGSDLAALRRCQSARKPFVRCTSDRASGRSAEVAVDVGWTGPSVIETPSALQGARGETAYVVALQDQEDDHARQRGRGHAGLQRAEVDRAEV